MLAIQTRQLHGTYRKKDRIYREDLFYGQGKAISEADQKELAADIAERVSENPLAYEGNTHHFHLEKGDLVTAKKVDWRPQSNSPPSVANTHTYTHTHTNRHAHERSNPSKSPIPFYRPVELETKMKQREVRTPSDVMTGSPSNVLRPRKEGGGRINSSHFSDRCTESWTRLQRTCQRAWSLFFFGLDQSRLSKGFSGRLSGLKWEQIAPSSLPRRDTRRLFKAIR